MRQLDIGVFGARGIPSTYGGYETFLTTLLPELARRGHHVTMYCRKGETPGCGPYEGVERVVLPAIRGKQFETLSHGAISSVRARLARHDVVFVVNVANAMFCTIHRYTGRSVVLNTDGQEWLRGKWGRAGRLIFKTSARVARFCATALVSDCASMATTYRDDFHARSTVIPYCVPARELRHDSGILEQLGVAAGEYFVVAARLNPENHVDAIADAYGRSNSSLPLLVLGVANYTSPVAVRLRAIAERDPRVRIVGHVADRDAFFELLGSARAYLHGHSVGGINPALVEAMHAGARIAALDTPFNREALGGAGCYFTLADVSAVLRELAAEPDSDADNMYRELARKRAAELYNVADVVDAYEQLLTAAAEARATDTVAIPTRWSTP